MIQITPSSRASDSGKWLCAHLVLFDKTYHFMKSECISWMILTRALCSPPFPQFLGRKWKRRRSNSAIFRIQPRATPPAGSSSKFILVAEKLLLLNKRKKDVNGEAASDRSYLRLIFICIDICLVITSIGFPNFVGRLSIWQCISQEFNIPFKLPGHALFVFCQHHLTHMHDFMVSINCPQQVFDLMSCRYEVFWYQILKMGYL